MHCEWYYKFHRLIRAWIFDISHQENVWSVFDCELFRTWIETRLNFYWMADYIDYLRFWFWEWIKIAGPFKCCYDWNLIWIFPLYFFFSHISFIFRFISDRHTYLLRQQHPKCHLKFLESTRVSRAAMSLHQNKIISDSVILHHHSVFYYIDSNRIEQGCLGCCQMHCNNTDDRQYQFACIYRDKWSEFLFSSADVNLIDCNVCDILWIYFHYVIVFERNRWKIKKIRFSMLLMKDE